MKSSPAILTIWSLAWHRANRSNGFLNENKHPGSRFYGFDTFDGLPEDWGLLKRGI